MPDAEDQHLNLKESQENDTSDVVGYPKLSRMMSLSSETAIFRRFRELNMLNLLRLQAELQDLEHQLREIRQDDAESNDPDRIDYVKDFRLMRDSVDTNDTLQHDLLVRIGQLLETYNTALIQSKDLVAANTPSKRDVKFLQDWLIRPKMGNNFLVDHESHIWDASNVPDLMTLQSKHDTKDAFSSLLDGKVLTLYDRMYGHRKIKPHSRYASEGIKEYKNSRIMAISKALSGLVSSLLPTLAILILYFVNRMLVRIGLVILFTAIFSSTLSLLTEAKRAEVFSATAAFAAVEVVFIGSANTNSTS